MGKACIKTGFWCFLLLLTSPFGGAKPLILNDIDWPPYFFSANNGNLPGLAKDVLQHCLAQSNVEMTFVNLPVKRTHLFMQSGMLDITVYSYKPERENFVIYGSEPIFNSEYGFVVNADSGIEIESLEDLNPLTVGHMPGLSHTPALMKIIDEKRQFNMVAEGHSVEALFSQMLSQNPRFDIMPNSKSTFFWKAKELGISDKIEVLDFVLANKEYYVTVSKKTRNLDQPELFLQNMDDCLIRIKENGVYQKILERYGFEKLAK